MFSDLLACVGVCLFGGHTTDQKRTDSEKSFRKKQATDTLNDSFQSKTLLVGLDSSQSIFKQIWKQIHNTDHQTHPPSQIHVLTPQRALAPACLSKQQHNLLYATSAG